MRGRSAEEKEIPFQAFLELQTEYSRKFCGGSLVHPIWVLSAGHCMDGVIQVLVQMGSNDLNDMPYKETSREIFVQPGFSWDTLENDVALVKLTRKAEGPTIQVIAMAPKGLKTRKVEGHIATASGFGLTDKGGGSRILMKVDLAIISNKDCAALLSRRTKIRITDQTICASDEEEFSGICSGDSGGPLTITLGGKVILIGVSSWSNGRACLTSLKSGFSLVSGYRDWIDKTIEDNSN